MTVLYFGLYDPSYARNWVLINGLRKNGVNVVELRRKPGYFSVLKLFFDYLKLKYKFDVMIVGFPGQEAMFLAKLITLKPIILDVFTSHYGGYVLDRKKFSEKSLRAKFYRFLDKWSCKLADVVLLDTQAHIDFFVKEFKLESAKFRRIWIGANDDNFKPMESRLNSDNQFRVIFFGTYVPLQGAEYIIKAAKILEDQNDIVFKFIGKGQDRPKVYKLAEDLDLKNIMFNGMMAIEKLREEIENSDVCLGIFGNTPKTSLVIPNKVYEAVAMAKPVITADTRAIRELFDENDMLLVKPADPESLAEEILKLKNDPVLREKLAVNGYNKFTKFASSVVLGRELKEIIEKLLHAK